MKISMPMTLTAADSNTRIVSGRIVTWNEEGFTSAGRTMFKPNSITFGKNVKLLWEHRLEKPLGKLITAEITDQGIEAQFKIAGTMAGDDYLTEAAEGLRDGLSVGVKVDSWTNNDGTMVIDAAKLVEVSAVTEPAIDSARVAEVAASEGEENKDSAPATAEADKPTEGEQVSDTTVPAPAEETVEAAKVEAAAPRPAFFTAPRLEFTKAKYLEASIRAKVLGDDASRQYVLAADDSTSNNAGLIPTRQLTEVVNPLSNADRPLISAISSGVLPDAGMSFEIPKITAVPTVGVEAEAAAIDETGMTNSFISVSVKKFAGAQTFSVELLDRSSPAFFDELVRQMEFAYAKETNRYVMETVANDGVLNATGQNEDASGLLAYIASAAAAVYKGSLGFARNLVVSAEQWAKILGYNDNGRPIYNAVAPQNAGGAVAVDSLRGNVAGLNLFVDRTFTGTGGTGLGDYSMVVLNPDSYTWYESPRFRLETNVVSSDKFTGQIKVAYYGYGALATKVAAGANWFNKA